MVIVFKQNAKQSEKDRIKAWLLQQNFQIHESVGENLTLFGVIGDTSVIDPRQITVSDAVEKVMRVQEPFKKANRLFHPEDSVIDVSGVKVGGKKLVVMAGPCSIETTEQMNEVAASVKAAGAAIVRGGAFKPRTSPYSFQGLEEKGLSMLEAAGKENKMPIVTEIMSADKIEKFIGKVDLIQVGARNMQNFALLKELGKTNVPVLLKRGMSATIEEWLMSAEYIMAGGNENVILCERGIRTFETYTRNTLDLSAVLAVKRLSHLPVIVDPSHAAGMWWMVESLAKAAVAVGADGLMIEVHNDPANAWCDGAQSLKPDKFAHLMEDLKGIATIVGREL